MEHKPWTAAVHYADYLYVVGEFDTSEQAKAAAEREARSRSEERVRLTEVWNLDGARERMYWLGRKPTGDWFPR